MTQEHISENILETKDDYALVEVTLGDEIAYCIGSDLIDEYPSKFIQGFWDLESAKEFLNSETL